MPVTQKDLKTYADRVTALENAARQLGYDGHKALETSVMGEARALHDDMRQRLDQHFSAATVREMVDSYVHGLMSDVELVERLQLPPQ
jgi:hypothetical protein